MRGKWYIFPRWFGKIKDEEDKRKDDVCPQGAGTTFQETNGTEDGSLILSSLILSR